MSWRLALLLLLAGCGGGASTVVSGSLVIESADNFAGAISSLKWNGFEYIDRNDHGRLLQSAVQLNGTNEAENPTEAGASADGGPLHQSSSVLLSRTVTSDRLTTETRMAYWFPFQGEVVSDWVLRKDVQITGNVIRYVTEFVTADDAKVGQFEALTGYMPAVFSRMWTLGPGGELTEVFVEPDKFVLQPLPLIFSTADGRNAMGVWTPDQLNMGYGYWRYADPVVKWNLMTRIDNPRGTIRFTTYVIVGTLEQAYAGLLALSAAQS